MKSLINFIIALMAFAFYAADVAGAAPLPVVEILGKNYYVYEIRKGDTLFGISRTYGWDYNTLTKLNPKATSPLQKGAKIYYPSEDQTPADKDATADAATAADNPEFYTIRRGDTLYSVAKKYNTTVAAILKLNPGVSEKNFKADEKIRLPKSGTGVKSAKVEVAEERLKSFDTYKVEKSDTWKSIAEKTGVDEADLKEANKNAGEKPKNKSIVTVPNIDSVMVEKTVVEEDPRELTEDGIAEIYDDIHGISDFNQETPIKIALLLSDPTTRKDIEFSRGVLTALDRLKNSKIKINLSIIDANAASQEVLTKLSDFAPDLIFVTSEKGIPSWQSEFAEVSQTPMVNTFDVRNELYTSNPFMIQLLTPSDIFNEEIAGNIADMYRGYKLIFVGAQDSSDQIASLLKERWNKGDVATRTVESLPAMKFTDTGKYLIYGHPTKKEDVAELLNMISEIREQNPLSEIATLGRPSWIVFDESLKERLHQANTLIPSRFFYDKDESASRRFAAFYKSLFDSAPAKSFPLYAAMGYDASLFFIEGMASNSNDMNDLGTLRSGVQNDFKLERPENWTGLVNPVVYLVRFTPFNTIERTPLE